MSVKRERFIPGIFNYCDYWCERCAFTQRCRNFVMGKDLERRAKGMPPTDDATRAEFWNRLADQVVEATMRSHAPDWHSEIEEELEEVVSVKEVRSRRETVREHPLVRQAYAYMKAAGAWLESVDGELKAVARELLAAADSKFADGDYEAEARDIGDMIEVVAWYHTLIPPKTARALGDMQDASIARSDVLAESSNEDANGTGKVVLCAIERSMGAWMRLRTILPQREDEILRLLARLDRLKRNFDAALPSARSFVRPGFDAPAGV